MSDLGLFIAASALQAQQTGMNAVSQDLANVNTPDYIRQSVNLTALAGSKDNTGSGVLTTSVDQVSETVLQNAYFSSSAFASETKALNQVLNGAQAQFQEPGPLGLQSQLSAFWSGWDAVGNDPSNTSARTQLLSLAQQVTNNLNESFNGLASQETSLVTELNQDTTQVNSFLSQMASLNSQVVQAKGSNGDVNALVDQQNQLMDKLSNLIGVTAQRQTNGSLTVYLGGLTLVQGNQQTDSLNLTTAGAPPNLVAQFNSAVTGAAAPITSGTVAGIITAVTKLASYANSLNTVATNLATAVNNQQAAGFYWNGNVAVAGGNFFVNSGTQTNVGITAGNISVAAAVAAAPSQIAASSTNAGSGTALAEINNGGNALLTAELYNNAAGPDAAYQNFIGQLGADVQQSSTSLAAQTAASNSAKAANESVSGVSIDDETTLMLAYQHAYQAASKVVSTVDAMFQSLLQSV